MLAQRAGRIVNISSVSAHTGAGFSAVSKFAYCAAKAGVLGLTRGLAKELAPHVTVNAICPGMILTDLTTHMVAANTDTILRSIPLQRLGTPEDVAEVVAFLATVTPNFITGEVVDVDGGQWVN
jgi:3-oxoacyl-[acyl-carrier protein] reductase